MVLTNHKCTKSLYLSTLRYNYLPKKTKQNKKQKIIYIYFLILDWLEIFFFFFVEIRAFTIVELKNLAFNTSKSYFIYFTTSIYNTPNNKCFFFLLIHLK